VTTRVHDDERRDPQMTGESKPWDDVARKSDELGVQLRSRFDGAGAEPSSELLAVERALHALFTTIEDAIGAAEDAVRDPDLRRRVAELAAAVRHAVADTAHHARLRATPAARP
jgi:hypothetical protein